MGRPLIYLDANVVIRLVEGDAATRAPLEARLAPALGVAGSLVTSRLTRLECRSKPLRAGDLATLPEFDVFFAGIELVLAEVSPAVVERATDLRAQLQPQDARCPPLRHGRGGRRDGVLDRRSGPVALFGSAGGSTVTRTDWREAEADPADVGTAPACRTWPSRPAAPPASC